MFFGKFMNSLLFSYHVDGSCRHVTLVHVWKRQGASYFLKHTQKEFRISSLEIFLSTKTPPQCLKSPWMPCNIHRHLLLGTWLTRSAGSPGNGRGSYAGKGVPRKEYFEDQMEHTSWKSLEISYENIWCVSEFPFQRAHVQVPEIRFGRFLLVQVLCSQAVLCYVRC